MSAPYQNCASALDLLEEVIFDSGLAVDGQPVVITPFTTNGGDIDKAKMRAMRALQNTFIGDGNMVKINSLQEFCRKNDYKLVDYKQPSDSLAAGFRLQTPDFTIVVQSQ